MVIEDGTGAQQRGRVRDTAGMMITTDGIGALQAGYLQDTSTATNEGAGSIQLLNLTGSQGAYISSAGDASIGLGACIITNSESIVVGDGMVSHGIGSITALGGFWSTNSPQVNNWMVNWQTMTNHLTSALTGTGGVVRVLNALSIERQEIEVTSDGATITATITDVGDGSQLRYYFDGVPVSFPVPTNLTLTAGTSAIPQDNWIYVTPSGFAVTTSRPSGERAVAARASVRSAALVQTEGPLTLQRYTEVYDSPDDRSRISHIGERVRVEGAKWESGMLAGVTVVTQGAANDDVYVTISSGQAWQMHLQAFGAVTTNENEYYVMNDPAGVVLITNLNQISHDANSNAVLNTNNRWFNVEVVGWAASGSTNNRDRVMLLLSTGQYSTESEAIADSSGYSITSISPQYLGGAVRLATIRLRRQSAGSGTWTATVIDRRGLLLNSDTSGAGASAMSTIFADTLFRVYDDSDPTKLIAFQASGITANNTRTLTVQDTDGIIALLDYSQTWSAAQTITNLFVVANATNGTMAVNWRTLTNHIASGINYHCEPAGSNLWNWGSLANPWATGVFHTVIVSTNSLIIGTSVVSVADGQLTLDGGDVGLTSLPIQISWHLERPTNAVYNIKWFDCASADITLTRLMGKTEAGIMQGHIIETTSNANWNVYTTNLVGFSIGTSGTSFNSYTNFIDPIIEQGHWVGQILTNDLTGVTNTACTLHGTQVL